MNGTRFLNQLSVKPPWPVCGQY